MSTVSTKVTDGGRIVLPAEFRKQFDIEVGKTVNISSSPEGILITTPDMALRRLQKKFQGLVPDGISVVDEFIAERRKEAANE
ncbi:MAG: AbrB/MazE/SpoVT family DNA-binding domain-containing protein [Pyrinomonadaceae bacterium]